LPGDYATQVESAINAGVDMVMGSNNFRSFQRTLTSLVPARVPLARVDDAVRRILTVKCELGLFESSRTRPGLETIGSREHRALAREAVQKSLVLLKNSGELLPLAKTVQKLHIAGKNADDLGHQCGGWTIDWQGQSGATTDGTTIRRAIELTVTASTQTNYSRDASGAKGADVVVVVVGERPYAEGNGDSENLELDADDRTAVRKAKASGAKVVMVIVSGRPLILGETADMADAIVAAWLPGTEGQGVADVLFGDAAPTGKLGHSWPKTMQQIPINQGDPNYEPLFPYGFGLAYQRVATTASGVAAPMRR
jgi:beta-glucosidase